MVDIDTSSRKEQRKFGIVMAIAITVLGGLRWAFHRGDPPMMFVYVAAVFLVLGLVAPVLLKPVLIAWLRFALVLNWIVTHILLTVAFFLLITPTRYLISIFSDDPLDRKWEPDAETYWKEPDDQPDDPDAYLNQF
jgi:saxitoxin biosynthesis operon SxtJ-like protein